METSIISQAPPVDCWQAIINVSPILTFIAIVVGVIFSGWHLRNLSKASTASSYVEIFKFLQEDSMREARRLLLEDLVKKDFKDWLPKEKMMAEKVCAAYDVMGVMVRKRFIGKHFIIEGWCDSIVKCWEAAKLMIEEYRKNRGPDFWIEFERIYKKAKKRHSKVIHKKKRYP